MYVAILQEPSPRFAIEQFVQYCTVDCWDAFVDKIVDDDWTVRLCRALSATDVLSTGGIGMKNSMGREVRFS